MADVEDGKERRELTVLVNAYKAGNQNVFGRIYELTRQNFYGYAMYLMKNAEQAEDLLQDSYVEIIRSIDGLKKPDAFTSWSKTIIGRLAVNRFSKKELMVGGENDEDFIELEEEDTRELIPEASLDMQEIKNLVMETVEGLPAAQSMVIASYYFDEMKIKDIAAMMDVSENTIKTRLHYAKKALRERLEQYERENDIKLHSLAPIPLFIMTMKDLPTIFPISTRTSVGILKVVLKTAGLSKAAGAKAGITAGVVKGASGTAGAAAAGADGTAAAGIAAAGTAGAAAAGAAGAAGVAAAGTAGAAAAGTAGAAGVAAAGAGISTKAVAIVLAACVAAGGGGAGIIKHNHDKAETKKAEAAYSTYFAGKYHEWENTKWDYSNEGYTIKVIDKDKDKVPEFVVGTLYQSDTKRPYYLCTYQNGKVEELPTSDEKEELKKADDASVYPYTAPYTFISEDQKKIALIYYSSADESTSTCSIIGYSYKLTNDGYAEDQNIKYDSAVGLTESIDKAAEKLGVDSNYDMYDVAISSGKGALEQFDDLSDVTGYLKGYGIDPIEDTVQRVSKEEWGPVYKEYFAKELEDRKGALDDTSLAAKDINGDGVPEIFACWGYRDAQVYYYSNGKVHTLIGDIGEPGITDSPEFLYSTETESIIFNNWQGKDGTPDDYYIYKWNESELKLVNEITYYEDDKGADTNTIDGESVDRDKVMEIANEYVIPAEKLEMTDTFGKDKVYSFFSNEVGVDLN